MASVEQLWRTYGGWSYLVLVVAGLLSCFAGYKLFRGLLAVWGFIAGVTLAHSFLQGARLDHVVQVVAALLAGIVGAVLVSVLYVVGVFLLGAGVGVIVASALPAHALPGAAGWVLPLVLAVIGGVAALALQRPAISLFTALGGAWVTVNAVAAWLVGCPVQTFPARCPAVLAWAGVVLVAWVVLGILGVIAQWSGPRKRE